jgi:integrase/recombinase XerD
MYLAKPNLRTPYYQIVYLVDGKRKQLSTKEKLKSSALKFLSQFSEEQKRKPLLQEISLEQFKKEYLDYIKIKFSQSYYKKNEFTFKHFNSYIGNIPLKGLTLGKTENFILASYQQAKYTASNHCRNLRASLNYAVERKYIAENFLQRFKFPSLPKSIPQFIDELDLRKINSFVQNDTLKDMYLCYFHTGTRLNELIHLKWNNVDLQQRIIKITNSNDFTIKTKQERIIPLNNTTFNIFQKRLTKVIDINGYVFSKNGFAFNGDYVSKSFKKACRLAGFPELHLHQLRHSFCSNLIKKNVSVRVVMELAGHTNLATTQKYLHVKNESLFEAIKVLEG